MLSLFVGVDVSLKNNVVYIMKPDGEKYGSLHVANYLFLKCSGLAQGKDFKNTSATTIALMEQFDIIDDLANADLDQLAAVVIKASKNHYVDPECVAKTIQAAARGSYRLPRTVNDSVNQAMSVSIANMRFLDKRVKTLDAAILKQFDIIPNTIISIPGIGKVYSAGIIAEIGNIRRFKSRLRSPSMPD